MTQATHLYAIVDAGTSTQLNIAVNNAILNGWEPLGGVAVRPFQQMTNRDHSLEYYQAIQKFIYPEVDKENDKTPVCPT